MRSSTKEVLLLVAGIATAALLIWAFGYDHS
jgi:hypothetical protein